MNAYPQHIMSPRHCLELISGVCICCEWREPEPEKDPAAVALGRRGGLKGGKARAAKLSAERRREIAQKAAAARWKGEC